MAAPLNSISSPSHTTVTTVVVEDVPPPSPLAQAEARTLLLGGSGRKLTMTPGQASVNEKSIDVNSKTSEKVGGVVDDDEELVHLSATGRSGEDIQSQPSSALPSPGGGGGGQSPSSSQQQPAASALSNFRAFTAGVTGATPPSNSPPSPALVPLASSLVTGFHELLGENNLTPPLCSTGTSTTSPGQKIAATASLEATNKDIDNLDEDRLREFSKKLVKLIHTFDTEHQRIQALPVTTTVTNNTTAAGAAVPLHPGITRTESQLSTTTSNNSAFRRGSSSFPGRKMSIQHAQILHRLSVHQQLQVTIPTHGNSLPATPHRSPFQSTLARANFGPNAPLLEKLSPKKEGGDTTNVKSLSDKKITRHLDYSQNGPDSLIELNQYVLVEELGEGSQSRVYLGFDNNEQEFRAVKEIKRPLQTSEEMKRIRREIHIMKKLRHKNIVTLHEVIDDPTHNKLYLIMQYVEKGPLVKYTREDRSTCEPIEPNQLAYFARQICAGLSYLHVHGIAHRDVKPENILLGHDEQVFLADFGVSEVFSTINPASLRGGGLSSKDDNANRRQSMFSVVSDASLSSMASPCDFGSVNTAFTSPKAGLADPPLPITLSTTDDATSMTRMAHHHPPAPVLVQSPISSEGQKRRVLPTESSSESPHHNTSVTFLKNAKGTPAFFAPEILKGEVAEGKAAKKALDVWALGISFYMLLTGELPWRQKMRHDDNNDSSGSATSNGLEKDSSAPAVPNGQTTTVLKVSNSLTAPPPTSTSTTDDGEMDWQMYRQSILSGRTVSFPDSIFHPTVVERNGNFAFATTGYSSTFDGAELKQHQTLMKRWKIILEGMLDPNPLTRLSLNSVRKLVKQLTEDPEEAEEFYDLSHSMRGRDAGSPRSLATTVAGDENKVLGLEINDPKEVFAPKLREEEEDREELFSYNKATAVSGSVVRRRSSTRPFPAIDSRRSSSAIVTRRTSVTLPAELLFGQELIPSSVTSTNLPAVAGLGGGLLHSHRGSLLAIQQSSSSAVIGSGDGNAQYAPAEVVTVSKTEEDDCHSTNVSSPTRLRQQILENRKEGSSFDTTNQDSSNVDPLSTSGGGEREKRMSSGDDPLEISPDLSNHSSEVHNPRSPGHEDVSPQKKIL